MIREALVQLSLDNAFLCADLLCKTVSNDSSQCPRCHSEVINLASAFNALKAKADAASVLESHSSTEERADGTERQFSDHQPSPTH